MKVRLPRQVVLQNVSLLQDAVYIYVYILLYGTISKDTQFTELLLRFSFTILDTTEAQINLKNM